MEKYCKSRQATNDNTIRGLRFACRITKAKHTHTHTHTVCNTCCFSATTMATQTCRSVAFILTFPVCSIPKNSSCKSHFPLLIIPINLLIAYFCLASFCFLSLVHTFSQHHKPFESMMCRRPFVFTGLPYEINLVFI